MKMFVNDRELNYKSERERGRERETEVCPSSSPAFNRVLFRPAVSIAEWPHHAHGTTTHPGMAEEARTGWRSSQHLCVCERDRERERVCVCERERDCVYVFCIFGVFGA